MEEKNQIKIKLRTAIIIICTILVIAIIAIYFITTNQSQYSVLGTLSIKKHNNQDYYIIENDYNGEYDLQFNTLIHQSSFKNFEVKKVMNYTDYITYCKKWDVQQKYNDSSKKYLVFSYCAAGHPILEARLADVQYENNDANIYLWDYSSGVTADVSSYVLIIPTDRNVTNVNIIPTITHDEFKNIQKYNERYDPTKPISLDKPIIYLYPTEDTKISVKLLKSENITCSYPKYKNEWKVLAKPNGNLTDLTTNRQLYSLYYESKALTQFKVKNDGFVVKGEDSAKFLEEKLSILGLTERESEEFIIYWLPKLESNKYNYIRFATIDEINENMPLEINPNPDTLIRVLMTFKGLENPISVQEQKLTTPIRTGFVAVEWGGSEIH